MLYGIFCYNDEAMVSSWSQAEDDAVLAKRRAVSDKLKAKGKLGPAVRLMPTTAAVTVRNAKEGLVVDGPFAETKEQLLGFYLVDLPSLDEVVAFARELGRGESCSFEIRPLRLFEPGTAKL